jgi:hypothetical protein
VIAPLAQSLHLGAQAGDRSCAERAQTPSVVLGGALDEVRHAH